jgi:hypothetical protein
MDVVLDIAEERDMAAQKTRVNARPAQVFRLEGEIQQIL